MGRKVEDLVAERQYPVARAVEEMVSVSLGVLGEIRASYLSSNGVSPVKMAYSPS